MTGTAPEAHLTRRSSAGLAPAELSLVASLMRDHPKACLTEINRLFNEQVQGRRDRKTIRDSLLAAGLPLPPSGRAMGRRKILTPALIAQVSEVAAAKPEASIAELLEVLKERSGVSCCIATLYTTLRSHGIVRSLGRKSTSAPPAKEHPATEVSAMPRFRTFDKADLDLLGTIAQENPFLGADNLTKIFSERTGKTTTDVTVRRALSALGWRRKVRPLADSSPPGKDTPRYTEIHRPVRPGGKAGYPSDLTDAEWDILEPFLRGRRQRTPCGESTRATVNALMYMARTGCQWRFLPNDFPDWRAVAKTYYRWVDRGVWQTVNDALRRKLRIAAGREAEPSAAIIDSQSVKTTEKGGPVDSMPGRK